MNQERVRLICLITIMTLATAALSFAGFSGTDLFLPSVGGAPGVAPAIWSTTVWVFNPSARQADVTFYLLERTANTSPRTYTDTIPPGDTRRYDSAVETMFGLETFGALRITSNVRVVVGSRIYSQPGSALDESAGQFFAGIPASFAIGAGESTEIIGGWQTQPHAESPFRLNFGLVETTGTGTCEVEVTAIGHDGTVLGSKRYAVRQWEQVQKAFRSEFPSISTDNARLTVTVTSGTGRVIAFGSSVSNGLQDPSTLEMAFADGLLAEAGQAGTITGVTAGDGLSGGGTSGNVTLAVANAGINGSMIQDDAVTTEKISPSGGSDGQVLTVTAAGTAWQTLPSGSDGDISAVTAGNGLSGGGTSGEVELAIAVGGVTTSMLQDSSVTAVKLSPSGGSNGNVLMHNGSAVVWGQTEGLSLPYDGSGSSTSALFSVENSGNGIGIRGASSNNDGINGYSGAAGRVGVLGTAGHANGFGVVGTYLPNNTQGYLGSPIYGAWGINGASGNEGFLASAEWAVFGTRGDDSAVGGVGSTHGVYGRCTVGNSRYAGYFNGPVHVNGTLSKAGGSFKIDHPLDPENRTLSHSFVESPDMMNIYNGNVVTDDDGFAVVTLPEWFGELNRDFRYQLTVIGQFAQAIVGREVEDNHFVIQTNLGNVKVSWQVTGIRQDAWANAHRIPVEEDKPEEERGSYLAPEAWGQPDEMGLEWLQERALGIGRHAE